MTDYKQKGGWRYYSICFFFYNIMEEYFIVWGMGRS